MPDFEDIRPYNDTEVRTVLNRLANDSELHDVILLMKFPRFKRWLGWPLRKIIQMKLNKAFAGITTVGQLQGQLSVHLEKVLGEVTTGISISGLDALDDKKQYVFIGNHRDIAMDPAMVDLALHRSGRETVRIAIGDNLLTKPFTSDLMRINKSFIVKRSVAGRREKLAALVKLSQYIRHSITKENNSVWIAQREGRAKDGRDKTDPALIKMLTLSKEKEQTFAASIEEINLVPVAISYELDPCDNDKARELHTVRSGLDYQKREHEDLTSIYRGLVGEKGHIHVAFGVPVTGAETADEVAADVDRQIFEIYRLQPTNFIAYEMLHGENPTVSQWKSEIEGEDWSAKAAQFKQRMSAINQDQRDLAIAIYANPVCSRLEMSGN